MCVARGKLGSSSARLEEVALGVRRETARLGRLVDAFQEAREREDFSRHEDRVLVRVSFAGEDGDERDPVVQDACRKGDRTHIATRSLSSGQTRRRSDRERPLSDSRESAVRRVRSSLVCGGP